MDDNKRQNGSGSADMGYKPNKTVIFPGNPDYDDQLLGDSVRAGKKRNASKRNFNIGSNATNRTHFAHDGELKMQSGARSFSETSPKRNVRRNDYTHDLETDGVQNRSRTARSGAENEHRSYSHTRVDVLSDGASQLGVQHKQGQRTVEFDSRRSKTTTDSVAPKQDGGFTGADAKKRTQAYTNKNNVQRENTYINVSRPQVDDRTKTSGKQLHTSYYPISRPSDIRQVTRDTAKRTVFTDKPVTESGKQTPKSGVRIATDNDRTKPTESKRTRTAEISKEKSTVNRRTRADEIGKEKTTESKRTGSAKISKEKSTVNRRTMTAEIGKEKSKKNRRTRAVEIDRERQTESRRAMNAEVSKERQTENGRARTADRDRANRAARHGASKTKKPPKRKHKGRGIFAGIVKWASNISAVREERRERKIKANIDKTRQRKTGRSKIDDFMNGYAKVSVNMKVLHFVGLAVCVLAVVAVLGAAAVFGARAIFIVRSIEVRGGTSYSYEDIERISRINKGTCVFDLDEYAIKASIESANPYLIADVKVKPMAVEIVVREKKAFAAIKHTSGYIIVDEKLTVLEFTDNTPTGSFIFEGISTKAYHLGKTLDVDVHVNDLSVIIKAAQSVNMKHSIKIVNVGDINQITCQTKDGFNAQLGSIDNIEDKLEKLDKYIDELISKGLGRGIIDLRVGVSYILAEGETNVTGSGDVAGSDDATNPYDVKTSDDVTGSANE